MKACVLQFRRLPCCVLGAYGCFSATTPGVDRLASRSVVFDLCFATAREYGLPTSTGSDLRIREVRCEADTASVDAVLSSVDETIGEPTATLVRIIHPGLPARETGACLAGHSQPLARIDSLVDHVHRWVAGRDDDQWLLVVFAEQGGTIEAAEVIPPSPVQLSETLLHVPLLLWTKQTAAEFGLRRSELVETASVVATLVEWFRLDHAPAAAPPSLLPAVRNEPVESQDCIISRGDAGEWSVRTRQWHLVAARDAAHPPPAEDGNHPPVALYRKPDDSWDAMNVADQFPEQTDRLLRKLRDSVSADT